MKTMKEYLVSNSNKFFKNSYYYYSYGLSRSFISLSLIITLLFNDINILFRSVRLNETVPYCIENSLNIFCLLQDHLQVAKYLSIIILCIVASGWRPQLTGILHWWISYSFITSTPIVDGGDHAASVITLLFIPITLFDNRKWHWQKPKLNKYKKSIYYIHKFISLSFFKLVKFQVAIIYLHAAVGKCNATEWINGTAIYYWLTDPIFGMNEDLENIFIPILLNPFWVAIITWGVIAFEFLLFTGFYLNRIEKHILLSSGILFHVLIAVFHGLISFSLVMFGALIVFLLEVYQPIIIFKSCKRYNFQENQSTENILD